MCSFFESNRKYSDGQTFVSQKLTKYSCRQCNKTRITYSTVVALLLNQYTTLIQIMVLEVHTDQFEPFHPQLIGL